MLMNGLSRAVWHCYMHVFVGLAWFYMTDCACFWTDLEWLYLYGYEAWQICYVLNVISWKFLMVWWHVGN